MSKKVIRTRIGLLTVFYTIILLFLFNILAPEAPDDLVAFWAFIGFMFALLTEYFLEKLGLKKVKQRDSDDE